MTGTVAHHPADHPYVRHVATPSSARVRSVWDVDEVKASGASIVHLHFGFEHLTVSELAGWLEQLRRHRLALVLTVHDLHNPHLTDQAPYHCLLRLLIAEAEAVVTLTAWAATVVERAYGRTPHVIPHPHVVPLDEVRRRRHRLQERRSGVYVHAATCRPNLDVGLIVAVADVAGEIGGVRVHVRSPVSPAAHTAIAQLAVIDGVQLDVGPRLPDRALWDRIQQARAVLLPYRWGTHSGLLETATDLGTPSLAPAVGGHLDQGAIAIDRADPEGALHRAVRRAPRWGGSARERQRAAIVTAHQRLYASLPGDVTGAA